MLVIHPSKQTPSFCGPACLQMIFRYYGIHATQKVIGKAAGTTLSRGTGKNGLFKAAKHFGFTIEQHNNVSINQLRKWNQQKIPVMLDYYKVDEEPDTHYSVLLDITKSEIVLIDPEDARIHRLMINYFERVWFGFAGTIMEKKNFYLRRCYIITPKK